MRPRWLFSWALVRWGGRALRRQFLGGPSPQVRQQASAGWSCHACTHTAHTRLLLHNQFGRKGHGPEGGAPEPARLPEKVWTCYTHIPRGNRQRSHPDGEIARPRRDRAADRQMLAQAQGQRPGLRARAGGD